MPTLTYSVADPADAPEVMTLVRRAYRGPESRAGWTSEADLLDDQRIDAAGVQAKITDPDGIVLLGRDDHERLVSCCELVHRGHGTVYFGMFAVVPTVQGGGIGRQVLAEAERIATQRWAATTLEMTVIGQRTALIEWYVRRGYALTGEQRPFPYDQLVDGRALRDDLYFEVLTKRL